MENLLGYAHEAAAAAPVGGSRFVGHNAQMSESESPTPRVVVVSPSPDVTAPEPEEETEDVSSLVEQPAKVMRIGTMIKQLLDEVRSAPLDDAARIRLAEIHERSLAELQEGLSPELVEELHRITLPFVDDQAPSDAELRIAQAQLVGWLEGLFHGIQAALVVQQMGNQVQVGQRKALPPGHGQPGGPGIALPTDDDPRASTGQYL